MYRRNCAIRSLILLPGATLGIAGCSPGAQSARAQPETPLATSSITLDTATSKPNGPRYRLTATIQELMDAVIDPAADVLWDSVAYIASTDGVEDRQPRTTAQWQTVRYSALTLIEAANLLSMPGRTVAAAHNPTTVEQPAGLGELSHAEIQERIDSTHDSFTLFAHNLQDAAIKALAAIDAKNAQGLMDAGGIIDDACEACHVTYWYPNQNRPGS